MTLVVSIGGAIMGGLGTAATAAGAASIGGALTGAATAAAAGGLTGATVGAGLLGGTVLGSGLGAVTGAATGQGAGKGALMGAVTGGVGGAAAPLAGAAGALGGTAGQIGAGAAVGAAANAAGAAAGGKDVGQGALMGAVTGGALSAINAGVNAGGNPTGQAANAAADAGDVASKNIESVSNANVGAAKDLANTTSSLKNMGITMNDVPSPGTASATNTGPLAKVGSTADANPVTQGINNALGTNATGQQMLGNLGVIGTSGYAQMQMANAKKQQDAFNTEQAQVGAQNAQANSLAPQLQGSGPLASLGNMAKGGSVTVGESAYIIPADVVSALGNGSTKAGAEFLQRLMDEIKKQSVQRQGIGAMRG